LHDLNHRRIIGESEESSSYRFSPVAVFGTK